MWNCCFISLPSSSLICQSFDRALTPRFSSQTICLTSREGRKVIQESTGSFTGAQCAVSLHTPRINSSGKTHRLGQINLHFPFCLMLPCICWRKPTPSAFRLVLFTHCVCYAILLLTGWNFCGKNNGLIRGSREACPQETKEQMKFVETLSRKRKQPADGGGQF